jgi:hypothetical protein
MKRLVMVIALFIGLISASIAIGQSTKGVSPPGGYVPSLAGIMSTMQLRHFKLYFAGKLENWELATYEAKLIRETFSDSTTLFPGIPVADMNMMAAPMQLIDEAIHAKDGGKFAKAYSDVTAACNDCHTAIGLGYIVMQIPTASPFSNQSFAPHKK